MNRFLLVEDDPASLTLLNEILNTHGHCDLVVDGREAVIASRLALEDQTPYDLICLDIMMPRLGGVQALKEIRRLERQHKLPPDAAAKVMMVSALEDSQTMVEALYEGHANAYLVKPIEKDKLVRELKNLGLLTANGATRRQPPPE